MIVLGTVANPHIIDLASFITKKNPKSNEISTPRGAYKSAIYSVNL